MTEDVSTLGKRHFKYWSAPKSYRYKEEAIYNHAPQAPGIYWIVTFDAQENGVYLYMGLALKQSVFDTLFEHWKGTREPNVQELFKKYDNLYFGFMVDSDAKDDDDLKDLFASLVAAEKPVLNHPSEAQPTGRYTQLTHKDLTLL